MQNTLFLMAVLLMAFMSTMTATIGTDAFAPLPSKSQASKPELEVQTASYKPQYAKYESIR